jgi:uncharacterized protein
MDTPRILALPNRYIWTRVNPAMSSLQSVSIGLLLLRFGIVVLILFALDWYVFQGVRTASANLGWGHWLRGVYWGLNAIVYLFVLSIPFVVTSSDASLMHLAWPRYLAGTFLAFLLFKLTVVLFLLGEDIYRLLVAGYLSLRKAFGPQAVDAPADATVWMDRKEFLSQTALFLGAIPLVATLDGMIRNRYNYRVHTVTLYYPDLPEAFDGLKITQLSDIHAGSFDDLEAVAKGLRKAQDLGGDVLVFTGDMVNNSADEAVQIVEMMRKLHAPYGKFSILGNHDYGDYVRWESAQAKADNLSKLKQLQDQMGFRLLLNEHAVFERGGERLALAGVENWGAPPFPQYGNLNRALNGIPKDTFTVLLSHDPTHYELEVRPHTHFVHLTLSGHTHGFQFGIEVGGFKLSPVQLKYPRWAGLYNEAGKYLYVNRGFGFIGFPGRVGILPEITLITLKRGRTVGEVV